MFDWTCSVCICTATLCVCNAGYVDGEIEAEHALNHIHGVYLPVQCQPRIAGVDQLCMFVCIAPLSLLPHRVTSVLVSCGTAAASLASWALKVALQVSWV